MSARIAAVRLGRTESGDVVLAEDPRSAFLLAAQGAAIPAGFEVPDEWLVGSEAADAEPVDLGEPEAAPAPAEIEVADEEPADNPAGDDPDEVNLGEPEDAPAPTAKGGAKGRKKTW